MTIRQLWFAYYTIVRKETIRMFRIWTQTLLPPAITTTLYFLVFGKFIGSQIPPIDGVSYMLFIIPGVIMISVITQSFVHTATGFYIQKFQKSLEELLVSPTPFPVIIAGFVTGGVLRGVLTVITLIVVALFFTPLLIHSVLILVLFALLTSILFSLAGLINSVFANSFDSISIFPTFILMPLTYLAGVFYSIALLPSPWSKIALWNPILYMVNGFRYGMIGISDVNITLAALILVVLNAVLSVVVWYLFATGRGLKT